MHPLAGANPATLLGLLARHRVDAAHLPRLGLVLAIVLLRQPFSLAERVWIGRPPPPGQPPVFVVGHWRSGTTFLYELLSRDPGFAWLGPVAAGLPWDMLLMARLLRPLLERAVPKGRAIDRVPVTPHSPQEDEFALANMQGLSFLHGLSFPRHLAQEFRRGVFFDGATPAEVARWTDAMRLLVAKLSLAQGERRALIKNPAHTARIALLAEMFPGAKFVHVHRNPFTVFQSMRRFHARLAPMLALQRADDAAVDSVILETYRRMMEALIVQSAALPPDQFAELSFEDLERQPLAALGGVYDRLGLPGFAPARPRFQAHLDARRDHVKNRWDLTPEVVDLVTAHWRPYLDRWRYAAPS
ncbi:MAG: sulfotransferase [Alphaproteobacteria bacterium]|nr:sulfotransferase [Alphaproteobacteria bacterium]